MTLLRFTKDKRHAPPRRVQVGYWSVEFLDPESLRTIGIKVDKAAEDKLINNVKGFKRAISKGKKRC